VQVVGFGTPALLSEDLIDDTKDFVTTVIADSDIIPRLSHVTVANAVIDMLVSTGIAYWYMLFSFPALTLLPFHFQ
jgi:hypothetical protein